MCDSRDALLPPVDKTALLEELIRRARADYETALQAQRATMAAATHEEAKPENDKDTRALESSYLARGQAARVLELQEALTALAKLRPVAGNLSGPIKAGSLIAVEEKDRQSFYFLVPAGAGRDVEIGTMVVKIVSLRSPLGRALIGQRPGDDFDVPIPGGVRELSIQAVW